MRKFAAVVAAVALSAGPAAAGIKVSDAYSAMYGFAGANAANVKVKTTSEGRTYIAGFLPGGLKYAAYFYKCDADGRECAGVSLVTANTETQMTVYDMNSWNRQRLPQAFLDSEGDPTLQLFTYSTGPYGAADITGLLRFWDDEVLRFRERVYAPSGAQGVSSSGDDARLLNATPLSGRPQSDWLNAR